MVGVGKSQRLAVSGRASMENGPVVGRTMVWLLRLSTPRWGRRPGREPDRHCYADIMESATTSPVLSTKVLYDLKHKTHLLHAKLHASIGERSNIKHTQVAKEASSLADTLLDTDCDSPRCLLTLRSVMLTSDWILEATEEPLKNNGALAPPIED